MHRPPLNAQGINSIFFYSLALLSYIPSITDVRSIIFCASFILWSSYFIFFSGINKIISKKEGILTLLYFLLIIINFFVANKNEVYFGNWVRSAIPMIFYSIFIIIHFYISNIDTKIFIKTILWSSLLYCLFTFIFNIDAFINFIETGGRLTFYIKDSVVPFPFIGLIICIIIKDINTIIRFLLFTLFFLFTLAVGYKVQLIFIFLLIILNFIKSDTFYKFIIKLIILSLLFLIIFDIFGDYLINRMSTIGGSGDKVRLLEIEYALSIFRSNPLLGSGLGVLIPLDETRDEYIISKNLWENDAVSYIHNAFFYFLMCGGIFFTAFLLFMIFKSKIFSPTALFSKHQETKCSAWCAVGLILCFCTSALFKQVQSAVLFTTFASMTHFLISYKSNEKK